MLYPTATWERTKVGPFSPIPPGILSSAITAMRSFFTAAHSGAEAATETGSWINCGATTALSTALSAGN